MTDDRTEQQLRRALQDAARQVDVPLGTLPDAILEPVPVRRRPRVPVPAALALVLLLVAGSVAIVAARDDSSTSVGIAADGEPITAQNADLQAAMDPDATDDQIAAVRDFADATPQIAAYTFVSKENMVAEFRALAPCAAGTAGSTTPQFPPVFRFRVATIDDDQGLELALVKLPGVTQVATRPDRSSGVAILGPVTTEARTAIEAPSPTVVATTVSPTIVTATGDGTATTLAPVPGTAAPPTTTTRPEEPPSTAPVSKEIPFVTPAPAECTSTPNVHVAPEPTQTPAATLPAAGDPPADPAAAEQAIRDMWTYTHDGSISLDERFRDHLEDADELLPLMKSIGQDGAVKTTQILGVQFLSPTSAAVLSRNVFQGGSLDVVQLQYVALIDGQWKWTRETQCKAIARANVHCPEGP